VADVFVSYSRRDSEFVRRVAASVADAGKECWMDTDGIADGEVFPLAIRRAIEQSDAFLFVITPPSVDSSFCEQEVEYARELQKRIVPVLRERVPDERLPAEIRDRNWIPFTDSDDFDASMGRLLDALERDLEHAQEHTRWLVKALEWDAEGRERSFLLRGSELAAAEAWLARSPEGADPAPTALQRGYLLASREAATRRQRLQVVLSLAVAAAALALVVFALISRSQAQSQKTDAQAQALASASQAQLANDPEISVLLATRAVHTHATPQTMFALREALDASPLIRTLPSVMALGECPYGMQSAVSPDGTQAAEYGGCHDTLLLANLATGHELRRTRIPDSGRGLAYDPKGELLAVGIRGTRPGASGGVALLDARTLAVRAMLHTGFMPMAVSFDDRGDELAAGTFGGVVDVFSLPGGRLLRRLAPAPGTTEEEGESVVSLAFSKDGRSLIVGGYGGGPMGEGGEHAIPGVRAYDLGNGRLQATLAPQGKAITSTNGIPEPVALSPDGALLAVGYGSNEGFAPGEEGGRVAVYSARTWKRLFQLASLPSEHATSLAFSPDGASLAVGTKEGPAGVWSLARRSQTLAYQGPTGEIASVAFTPDGTEVLTAADDGTVRLSRTRGGERAVVHVGSSWENLRPRWVDDDHLDLGYETHADPAAPDTTFHVASVTLPSGHEHQLGDVSFPNGGNAGLFPNDAMTLALVARTVEPGRPKVVSMPAFRLLQTLPQLDITWSVVRGEPFSPDGSRLAMQLRSGQPPNESIKSVIYDRASGRMITLQQGPSCSVIEELVWSADGRRLAGNTAECGVVHVWDASTGRLLRQINEGGEVSKEAALNGDGSRLLVGSYDSRATVWDVASGKALVSLIGHTRGIQAVALSRSGSLAATAGADHTVRLWNARTGQLMRIFRLSATPSTIEFSPDGSQLAIELSDNELQVWQTCPHCENARGLLAEAAPHEHDRLTMLERTITEQPG
jgi:WD40 repeat protein